MRTSRIRSRTSGLRASLSGLSGATLLAVLVGYPLLSLLVQTVVPNLFSLPMSLVPSLGPLVGVFRDWANLMAVANSTLLGLEATVVAVIVGAFTAFAVESMDGYRRTMVDGLVWVVFFLPSYVIAQGWVMFMQGGGIASQLLGLPMGWSAWFFTRLGVVLIMGFSFFPYVHFSMQQGIRNVNGDLVKAGRLAGASRLQVFRRILLPLLTPALLAGASIAFAEAFGDFGIPLAVTIQTHLPLLPYQIYASLGESPVNYPVAAGLSLLVILVSAGAILLQFFWMRRKDFSTVSSGSGSIFAAKKKSPLISALSFLVFSLALLVPLGSTFTASLWKVWANGLGSGNWTLVNYSHALALSGEGVQSLGRSMEYALIVAVATMILGVVMAYQMSFQKSAVNSVLNILTMAVIAVPGIVLASAFIFAWNAVWLIPLNLVLYGTPICLAMAFMATYLPYAIRLQLGAMEQVPPSLLRAARVLGAGNATVVRKIIIPLVAGTAIATFFMAFSKVIFELPASILLYPPGLPTFSVFLQHTFNNFDWSTGSALTVVALLIVLASYSLGRVLINSYDSKHYGQRREKSGGPELTQEHVLVGTEQVIT